MSTLLVIYSLSIKWWATSVHVKENYKLCDLIQARWRGVVHHVVGVHAWVDDILGLAECEHPPMDRPTGGKGWLEEGSPAHKAMCGVVTNNLLLSKIDYYTLFRLVLSWILLNSLWPSDTMCLELYWPSLNQIYACRLVGGKPLPEPMLTYRQLDPQEHILMVYSKSKLLIIKLLLKLPAVKCSIFCSGLNVLTTEHIHLKLLYCLDFLFNYSCINDACVHTGAPG